MKTRHEILLALTTAAIGFAMGTPGTATREEGALRTDDAPASGSGKGMAAYDAEDGKLSAALTALKEPRNFREVARLGGLLAALDSGQMRGLLDRIEKWPSQEADSLVPRLLANWTKRDPEAATAWMQPRLARYLQDPQFGNGFADFKTNLVRAWAANAPERAGAYARAHPGSKLAEIALHNAIFAWPDTDYAHRFELLREFPAGKSRQKVVTSLCMTWAMMDRTAAFAGASSLPPGPEREGALGQILSRWAGDEPLVAFEKARVLGIENPALLLVMAKQSARRDPVATARWMEKQDAGLIAQIGSAVAKFWAESDLAAAFTWAEEHGISLMDTGAALMRKNSGDLFAGDVAEIGADSPFSKAMHEKPDAVLAWVRALPAGAARERYLELASRALPEGKNAQPLLAELPPESAARSAAEIASELALKDVGAAQAWAASLSGAAREGAWAGVGKYREGPLPAPGLDRDAMLGGIANSRAVRNPVQALDRVLEIGDPALRRRTFDDVLWQVNRGDVQLGGGAWTPGASDAVKQEVREWLQSAKIPEEWKKPWRE